MATHSSILAWRIPWTEEPGGYSPWGSKESDTPEQLSTQSETPTLRVWPPLISAQVSRPPPHTHPW